MERIPGSSRITWSMRSRRQPSILAFLAQDEHSQSFCYSNADLRQGEKAEEIFAFVAFWQKAHGRPPEHLVFDSKLTTYANLVRLDQEWPIPFIDIRKSNATESERGSRKVHGPPGAPACCFSSAEVKITGL